MDDSFDVKRVSACEVPYRGFRIAMLLFLFKMCADQKSTPCENFLVQQCGNDNLLHLHAYKIMLLKQQELCLFHRLFEE